MARACWMTCVTVFAAFVIACSGSNTSKPAPAPAPEKPGERAEGLGKPVTIEGMEVTVRAAVVERAAMESVGTQSLTEEPVLGLIVSVRSTDPAKKFDYKTWAGGKDQVTDDLGNKYPPLVYSNAKPVGRTISGAVYSDKTLQDVLIFNRPVPAAKYLDVDLPAPFDQSKVFRFRVPVADIKKGK